MQPTSRVATGGFDVGSTAASASSEPPDVFCGLASLIVEGRIPRNDVRGYGEGPHVPPYSQGNKALNWRHECSDENNMCKKDENFRKHMLLLWQNNVPVSIEVLLCPNCRVSQQKVSSVELSTIPEPGSILLEQWTVSVKTSHASQHLISSQGLFQAVRSYLHFSQLSAWYSSHRGQMPNNVLYRITIPGETFASKFTCKPEEHFFPSANVGRMSSVHVSVRSLPRCDEIPRVTCPHQGLMSPIASRAESSSSSSAASSPSSVLQQIASLNIEDSPIQSPVAAQDEQNKLPQASGSDMDESNLRKSLMVKSKLAAECHEKLPRSDSMDSMLGDSLLDPPQSLQKIPPKRYQSPSRCGSPSLEAPDHLLFGSSISKSESNPNENNSRLARQDLLRRRDINLYTGLHPRLLHGHNQQPQIQSNQPRLSLFSNSNQKPPYNQLRSQPCRAFPASASPPQMPSPSLFFYKAGQPPSPIERPLNTDPTEGQKNLGAKKKSSLKKAPPPDSEAEEEEDDEEAEDGVLPPELSGIDFEYLYSKSNCSSRRSSLKDEDSLFPHKCKKKTTLEDILGIQPESGIFSSGDETRVYRAEIPPLPAKEQQDDKPDEKLSKSDILLGAILRTCERNRHLEESSGDKKPVNQRLRSFSERHHLEPLDLSFDTPKDWSEDEEDEDEEDIQQVTDSSRRSSFSSDAYVPTQDECASFRQSFDSATSMVFHRRTGLPLTSSPAPLRRGTDKFDFDDSITSPHDIKKALFAKNKKKLENQENKENIIVHRQPVQNAVLSINKRERRPSKKLLSASAPATLTSNNLLGNFEESVLNGRLEPNSTVEGFTAEIGASGSFQPKHKTLPVTVFFYTLCDNAAYSSPYLGHINLGKKGYRVPPKGTIQVTLFNPLGTVVKMFVVMYDLSDMPPNSQTFLRQRTLYMPSDGVNDAELQKWLRYLVHLRFASSNSGKIYLHTDIRMIIFRKSDLDTAADYTSSKGFELRSFTQGPANPKFSPRR